MRASTFVAVALATLVSLEDALAFQPMYGPTAARSALLLVQTKQPKTTALAAAGVSADAPPLSRNPSRKICLMVEPTPFTHVSGYANRFKEMLKFLKKAGDQVDILTVDSKTPVKDLPKEHQGFPIRHTQGFTFPLYNHISLTIDLPEMKVRRARARRVALRSRKAPGH